MRACLPAWPHVLRSVTRVTRAGLTVFRALGGQLPLNARGGSGAHRPQRWRSVLCTCTWHPTPKRCTEHKKPPHEASERTGSPSPPLALSLLHYYPEAKPPPVQAPEAKAQEWRPPGWPCWPSWRTSPSARVQRTTQRTSPTSTIAPRYSCFAPAFSTSASTQSTWHVAMSSPAVVRLLGSSPCDGGCAEAVLDPFHERMIVARLRLWAFSMQEGRGWQGGGAGEGVRGTLHTCTPTGALWRVSCVRHRCTPACPHKSPRLLLCHHSWGPHHAVPTLSAALWATALSPRSLELDSIRAGGVPGQEPQLPDLPQHLAVGKTPCRCVGWASAVPSLDEPQPPCACGRHPPPPHTRAPFFCPLVPPAAYDTRSRTCSSSLARSWSWTPRTTPSTATPSPASPLPTPRGRQVSARWGRAGQGGKGEMG